MSDKYMPFIPREEYMQFIDSYNKFGENTVHSQAATNESIKYLTTAMLKMKRELIFLRFSSIFLLGLIIFIFIIK